MIFNLKLSVLKRYTFLKAIRNQIGFYPLEFHSGLNRIQTGFDLPTTYTLLPTHYYRRQFLLPTRCYLLCLPVTCSLLPVTYYLGQLLVLLWTCSRSLLRTAYVAAQKDGWCPYPWIWRRENTNGNSPRPEMKVTNECDTMRVLMKTVEGLMKVTNGLADSTIGLNDLKNLLFGLKLKGKR